MKKRHLYIIIFTISVIGLGVTQYQYLKIGLNLAKVQFNQNIGKSVKTIQTDLSYNNKLTFLLGKAITNDDTYFKTKLDSVKEASIYYLNDFLAYKLLVNGIKTNFEYKIYVKDTSLYLTSKNFIEQETKLKIYPIQLKGYLPNLVHQNVILELQFNKINEYFLFQLNGLIIPSFIFMMVIILVVIWVLRSFYWQQSIITRTNDFINNLTHELKTPVFSIGLATKMLRKNETKETKAYLDIIKNENERLKEQIENVLQLARFEGKNNNIKLTEVDFYPYILKLCKDFKRNSEMEAVDFKYDIKETSLKLKCHTKHLSNAINNLLDNAKKYSFNKPKIDLEAFIIDNKLCISITDNGIGINKEHQKNVFKKHFRIPSGDLYTVKGYGLGLYYVKKMINLHKGKIFLESKLNLGTKITISIPIIN
ncbi:MAG: HAMP domain-containing sensor histidine kinase [Flavobacteriaceae bacterium]